MLNLLYSQLLHCRHPGYTALNLTGVSVERLLLSFKKVMGSVTLCALTVTTGTEASKLKMTRRRSPIVLESWQQAPCLRDVGASSQTYSICWKQSSGAAVTVLMCVLFIYCICLYLGKYNNMKSLEHLVIWSPSDLWQRWMGSSLALWNSQTTKCSVRFLELMLWYLYIPDNTPVCLKVYLLQITELHFYNWCVLV